MDADTQQKAELLALKRRRLALLHERQDLTRGFGLLSYRPHARQHAFHSAGAKLSRLGMAGNRSGKSQGGCAEDCAWLMNYRPWYKQTFDILDGSGNITARHEGSENHPLVRLGIPQRSVKGHVITIDWDKVDEIWTGNRTGDPQQDGKIWQLLPGDFVRSTRRNHSGVICEINCQNGSKLTFDTVKSWKNDPLAVESSDFDFIHVDEPCPEDMFKGASRGLVDRGGAEWFTLTPLREMWILDRFFPRNFNSKNLPMTYEAVDKWCLRWSMYDNPFISSSGRRRYEETLTADERECRITGIPLELSGLVYKDFDWDKHVLKEVPLGWDSFSSPPRNWPIYAAFDVHPQTAQACLLLTVSPQGQKFFFDEFFRKAKIDSLCDWFKSKTENRHVVLAICDPSAWIPNPVTKESIENEFAKHKVFVEKGTKALSHGIIHAQGELAMSDNIYVSPHLETFLFEIQRYCWDEEDDRPVDKDDHMMENMYRLLLEEPIFVDFSVLSSANQPVDDIIIDRIDMNDEFAYLKQ